MIDKLFILNSCSLGTSRTTNTEGVQDRVKPCGKPKLNSMQYYCNFQPFRSGLGCLQSVLTSTKSTRFLVAWHCCLRRHKVNVPLGEWLFQYVLSGWRCCIRVVYVARSSFYRKEKTSQHVSEPRAEPSGNIALEFALCRREAD